MLPDETKSNLEPIEENDLNLKDKFLGGTGAPEKSAPAPEKSVSEIGKAGPEEKANLEIKKESLGQSEPEKAPEQTPEIVAEPMSQPMTEQVPEKLERKEGIMEKDEAYNKILSQVSSATPVVQNDVSADAEKVSREQDAQSKINKLVELAETKGIPHAVKVARHFEDNYVLDEFHDKMLGEELHSALVAKGLIKEI